MRPVKMGDDDWMLFFPRSWRATACNDSIKTFKGNIWQYFGNVWQFYPTSVRSFPLKILIVYMNSLEVVYSTNKIKYELSLQ